MTDQDTEKLRESVIAALARRREGLGRTALMKLIYFLQELRNAPLGYTFRIYTYGPYDGQVLDDLQTVESKNAVHSQYYEYDYGTGYRIQPEVAAENLAKLANDELGDDLDWIVENFGCDGAADLEMASTIVFVDRRNDKSGENQSPEDIASLVYEMKPHLARDRILRKVNDLQDMNLLRSTA